MDGCSHSQGDCVTPRRIRVKKYNKANKRKQGFYSMKSRLKVEKALLKTEVEKVTKQKDCYQKEAVALLR